MKKLTLVTLGAVGVAVGAVAVWSSAAQPTGPVEAAAAPKPVSSAPLPGPTDVPCPLLPGTKLAFDLEIETQGLVDGALLGLPEGAAVPSQVRTSARLEAESLTYGADGAVLLARLAGLSSAATTRAQELTEPFLFRVAPTCQVTAFARHEALSPALARVQQAMVAELAWTWPKERASLEGEDGVGAWRADVVASADDQGVLVQRSVREYGRVWGRAGLTAVPADSLTSVRPGQGPWFESLTGSQSLTLGAVQSTTTVRATRVAPSARALADAPRELARYVWEDLLPQGLAVREPRPVTRSELEARAAQRDVPFESALAGYVERVKQKKGLADTWTPLTTWLEAHPEGAKQVVDEMKHRRVPAEATAGLYIALGRARTTEARTELLGVMNDEAAPNIERIRAMFNLIDRDDVGLELAQSLDTSAQEVPGDSRPRAFFAREALLGLSTMAGLRGEPAVTALAVAAVKRTLATQRTARALKAGFGAVGNLGDPSLLADVEPFTRHAEAAVREAATLSVRRMPPAATATFVIGWLERETDSNVRATLYDIVRRQLHDAQTPAGPELVRLAVADLTKQPSLLTRKSLVTILGRAARESADARAALKAQARVEFEGRTPLFNVIAKYLSPEEITEVVTP